MGRWISYPPSEMLGIERAIQVDGVKQHGRLNASLPLTYHPAPDIA